MNFNYDPTQIGHIFENYMTDFINLLEFCGAKKLPIVSPLDFHFSINKTELFIECKAIQGEGESISNPNFSFRWVNEPGKEYYRDEIKMLDALDKNNNCSWLVIWSPVWQLKKHSAPFHYIRGHDAFKVAFKNDCQYLHLEKNKMSHVFEPLSLLKECPFFLDVFENVSPYDIPFATYNYPNIFDYENPAFSTLIITPDKKREIKGFLDDGFGRKKLMLSFPKGDNFRVIPVLNKIPKQKDNAPSWTFTPTPDSAKKSLFDMFSNAFDFQEK